MRLRECARSRDRWNYDYPCCSISSFGCSTYRLLPAVTHAGLARKHALVGGRSFVALVKSRRGPCCEHHGHRKSLPSPDAVSDGCSGLTGEKKKKKRTWSSRGYRMTIDPWTSRTHGQFTCEARTLPLSYNPNLLVTDEPRSIMTLPGTRP